MGSWNNSDGLFIKFGTDKATANKAGEYKNYGALREIELKLTLTGVTSVPGTIVSDQVFFPEKVQIEEIEIVAEVGATSSGTPLFNLGLAGTDRTTQYDYDGLLAAVAMTVFDAAGEKTVIRVGSTGAGALIGTVTSSPAYLCANLTSANYTAGALDLRIRYFTPTTQTS